MNEGHSGFHIAVSTAEMEGHREQLGDVLLACDIWLRRRGLRSGGEKMHETMMSRRRMRAAGKEPK